MTARTDLTTPSIILIARLGLIDGVNILPKYARPGACSVNFTVNLNLKFHLEIVIAICNAHKFQSSSIDDSMVVCFDFDGIGQVIIS